MRIPAPRGPTVAITPEALYHLLDDMRNVIGALAVTVTESRILSRKIDAALNDSPLRKTSNS